MFIGRRNSIGMPRMQHPDEADTLDMVSSERAMNAPVVCHCGAPGELVEVFSAGLPGWLRRAACPAHVRAMTAELRREAATAGDEAE